MGTIEIRSILNGTDAGELLERMAEQTAHAELRMLAARWARAARARSRMVAA
jgi:hypothetical protein